MTTALILAGGTGRRMNSTTKPKQFLEMQGKPIIIYTLEHFEEHEQIDEIIVVCIESQIGNLKRLVNRYEIDKVKDVIPGGPTGHDSIYCGIQAMRDSHKNNDIILLHDGVRPLISLELITRNLESVEKYGNGITVESVKESVALSKDGRMIENVPLRHEMYSVKAPQAFRYGFIRDLYDQAHAENLLFWDAASMCSHYGKSMHMVESSKNNIKITEPADYYIYRALYELQEEQQIFGL